MSEYEVEDGQSSRGIKRRRLGDPDEPDKRSSAEVADEPIIQDLQYNASDGDICVLRVRNTTFRVHRYLLSRDSVVFRDMFSSLTGGKAEMQETPIHLHGDQILYFRDLCWALYALPADLLAQLKPDASVGRVFRIAIIANKYQFLSIEKWAIETLKHHCIDNGYIMKTDADPKPPLLLKVTSLCTSTESEDLREVIEENLMSAMMDMSYNLLDVFHLIEMYGSRRLIGMAYYYLLQHQERTPSRVLPNTAALGTSLFQDPNCPTSRNLDRGFYSLTRWWDHFVITNMNPQNLPRDAQCSPEVHSGLCAGNWQALFNQFMFKANSPSIARMDILGRLDAIEDASKAGPFASPVNRQCVTQWSTRIAGTASFLMDTMADQFLGCVKPDTSA